MIFAHKTRSWTQIRFYHYAPDYDLEAWDRKTYATHNALKLVTFEAASTCLQGPVCCNWKMLGERRAVM